MHVAMHTGTLQTTPPPSSLAFPSRPKDEPAGAGAGAGVQGQVQDCELRVRTKAGDGCYSCRRTVKTDRAGGLRDASALTLVGKWVAGRTAGRLGG